MSESRLPVVTLCGSVGRFRSQMRDVQEYLEGQGIIAHCPNLDLAQGQKELSEEDVKLLELDHCNSIRKSDAVYVVNPDGEGYYGKHASFELGFAYALCIPRVAMVRPSDPADMALFDHVYDLDQIVSYLRGLIA